MLILQIMLMLKYLCFGVGLFLNVSKPWDAEEIIHVMFDYSKKNKSKIRKRRYFNT